MELFCSQSDAESEYRNRFRIGANLKFFVPCHTLTCVLTSITSVTLRNQKFLSIRFWSLSDLVSENRVRFARSIKKYFHFRSKSLKKSQKLLSQLEIF